MSRRFGTTGIGSTAIESVSNACMYCVYTLYILVNKYILVPDGT